MKNSHLAHEHFNVFSFSDGLMKAIAKAGFTEATSIQLKSIPSIHKGKDLLIEAQTGSGKTACFVWPILERLVQNSDAQNRTIGALILTPTRELALQIVESFGRFSEFLPREIRALAIIGGEKFDDQKKALHDGVDIIAATPGRLLDLCRQNILILENVNFFVLDEADKILDLNFAQELDEVLKLLPKNRQNLFFSATYSEKVLEIAARISENPEHIKIEDVPPTVENIEQRVIEVNRENRGMLLRHLIKIQKWKDALIFVSSKTLANNLSNKLEKAGVKVSALHSDLSQAQRNKALSDFKAKKIDFLVATDVAARGIDIDKLNLVINFDLPRSSADYIHRIGRTGRAGEKGLAISFIGHEDQDHFKLIEKRAKVKLTRESVPGFELTGEAPVISKAGGIKGKKKSKKDKLREAKALNQK